MGQQPPGGGGHVGGCCADPSGLLALDYQPLPWLVMMEIVKNKDLAAEGKIKPKKCSLHWITSPLPWLLMVEIVKKQE
jgi:hypothetical protein